MNKKANQRQKLKRKKNLNKFSPMESLDFSQIKNQAKAFADYIEKNYEKIAEILLEYESFEVVQDEVNRSLDHLRSLHENKQYFKQRIGPVTSFLPRNQPMYALTCFVLVPSFMASSVHFRIPHSMKHFFPKLLKILKINKNFPNVIISKKERLEFLKERSALKVNPKTQESWPITDAVIFTGTSHHADRLRLVFDQRTLFIANGSGHNPIVVTENADLPSAVEATLTLQLYNQGQDCAAPNTILVHKGIYNAFLRMMRSELLNVRVGHYKDRTCRVGPISDPEDLIRIQSVLIEHREWLDPTTPGRVNANDAIVEPTIICKPLKEGGNFSEVFAPLIFLQKYESDEDLKLYFESPHYPRNAMYVTVYGESSYVKNLINKEFEGKVLHDKDSVLFNTHLHAPGMERGTKPYGGRGYSSSSYSIHGKIVCTATLPQREIFENLAKPLLKSKAKEKHKEVMQRAKKITYKDVQKLLGLKILSSEERQIVHVDKVAYVDSHAIKKEGRRYVQVQSDLTFHLLEDPNLEYFAKLEPKDIRNIRMLRQFLVRNPKVLLDEFTTWLYALPKEAHATDKENKENQLIFYKHIYNLIIGNESGPRLAQFLLDVDRNKLLTLLDL